MTTDPNSFDAEIKDAQANPESTPSGTDTEITGNPTTEGEPNVDYKTKFAESSKEALRILAESKEKDRIIADLTAKANAGIDVPADTMESMYPNFDQLSPEDQQNLIRFSGSLVKKVKEDIYKDPALAHSRAIYNESKWNLAFGKVSAQFPELSKSSDEFKSKYYNANNVPDNIESILGDLAKVYLFDKAKEIGAADERAKQNRIDLNRNTGGDRAPSAGRTLEDWSRMAVENPQKFAQLSKEYRADLESGKLKE